MRKVLIAVFMMMALISVSAAGEERAAFGEDTFVIKGYKMAKTPQPIAIYITNAVTERLDSESSETAETGPLDIAAAGDTINLSSVVGSLLGSSSETNEFHNERVIFSYRIVGYEAANLTLTMTFDPFKRKDSEDMPIHAIYRLGNLSYSFPDHHSDVSDDGDRISGVTVSGNSSVADVTSTADSISTSFSVIDDGNNGVPRWAQRGAVAMTIENSSYQGAGVGDYTATVTVRLTENT